MKSIITTALILLSMQINAQDNYHEVAMRNNGLNSFYVATNIQGVGESSLLVDTGAGYSTISQNTLELLQETGDATYLKKLEGVLADGSRIKVPLYRITSLNIGGNCQIRDIEVAVFPNRSQEILGLNILEKVSPFIFSTSPPRLFLNNCNQT